MCKIIPAIMPYDFRDIENHVADVKGLAPWIQIDIMDGVFVPAKTWPYSNGIDFDVLISQEKTLPDWEHIDYELDMMVSNPVERLADWIKAGIARVIIHIDSVENIDAVVAGFADNYRIIDSPVGVELMLAVSYDADPDIISSVVNEIEGVQIMGIDPVGVQGAEFKRQALDTIRAFRDAYPNLTVSVDGGVKEHLLEDIFEAGAHRVVMGSGIYEVDDVKENLKELLTQV